MSKSLGAPISSLSAISNTIKTDALVYRWFLYLINLNEAKEDLAAHADSYTDLNKKLFYQNLCVGALWLLFFYVSITQQYIALWAIAFFAFIYLKLCRTIRENVSTMGLDLIAKHFKPDDVGKKTLYQIGEHLADQYKAKSLVIVMTTIDGIIRNLTLFTLIFAVMIVPLDLPTFIFLALVVYWTTQTIINIPAIYTRII